MAAVAALLLLGPTLLSGCSTNIGELPFPAVHDMPPTRPDTTLSDAEQKKAAQDLITARDGIEARAQQNAQAGTQADTAATGGVQSAAAGKSAGQQTGGSRSP